MMAMLSQLMGGMPGGTAGAEGADGGLPPGLAAMLGGMGGGAQGQQGQGQGGDPYDYVWKILHALFAFVLAAYVTATTRAFSGPMVRIPGKGMLAGDTIQAGEGTNLFWAFATAELILQSTRYFLERGRTGSQLGGWMGMASGMVPEPYRSYVRLVGRYSGIWSTIVEDGMVVVFIVGIVSWWKGAVG